MKKEKIILLIIALLIILMICIVGLILVLKKPEENSRIATEEIIDRPEIDSKLKRVTNRNNFYIVQSCVEKFYTYYSDIFDEKYEGYLINNEQDKAEIKAERVEKVYKMLDEEYIQHEGITLQNLESKLSKTENTSILIRDMYCTEKNERISAYFVYGTKNGTTSSKAIDFSIMIKVDLRNRTFKLLMGEQVENYYKTLENGQEIEIKEEEINDDKYNTFSYEYIAEAEYINDLFMHYKKSLRFNKEQTYNLLDDNYKNICFQNLEEYLTFIDSNYSKIASAKIEEYNKENKGSYTEYLFKDKKGNYYIFREIAPFKYTVMLDNYTISTTDFEKEYSSLMDKEKLVMNIQKFFKGINDKNYGYSYSVLSEAFKNNKYPTKNDFINYAKQNFFDENEIEYESYEKENGVYIYKIKIKDATGKNTAEKKFNIIIKLNNGTNFEMSFGQN